MIVRLKQEGSEMCPGDEFFCARRIEPEELEGLVPGRDYLPQDQLTVDDLLECITEELTQENYHRAASALSELVAARRHTAGEEAARALLIEEI